MKIDRQDIFNRIVEHARQQNSKAMVLDQCRYRVGDPPKKCFIGCLIPDEKYDPSMEGSTVDLDVILAAIFDTTDIDKSDREFLLQLQSIHDQEDVIYWNDEFKRFSKEYNLTMSD